jgi:mannose-6-phosphate isomerase-like protein (cupin superfamily)
VKRIGTYLYVLLLVEQADYPDEVHDDLLECFIVLEGECECYIGDDVIHLGPGGFIDIPLYTHHDVKVIKGPVLAIVQRLKVA